MLPFSCAWFRNGAFGRAIARIPQLNMLDDHDVSIASSSLGHH